MCAGGVSLAGPSLESAGSPHSASMSGLILRLTAESNTRKRVKRMNAVIIQPPHCSQTSDHVFTIHQRKKSQVLLMHYQENCSLNCFMSIVFDEIIILKVEKRQQTMILKIYFFFSLKICY